jgi:hypothetical protein
MVKSEKQREYVNKVIKSLVDSTVYYPELKELLIPHCGKPFHRAILKNWEKEGYYSTGFITQVCQIYGLSKSESWSVVQRYGKRIKRKIRY